MQRKICCVLLSRWILYVYKLLLCNASLIQHCYPKSNNILKNIWPNNHYSATFFLRVSFLRGRNFVLLGFSTMLFKIAFRCRDTRFKSPLLRWPSISSCGMKKWGSEPDLVQVMTARNKSTKARPSFLGIQSCSCGNCMHWWRNTILNNRGVIGWKASSFSAHRASRASLTSLWIVLVFSSVIWQSFFSE